LSAPVRFVASPASHVLPGVGHFGPLERPDAVAAAAFRFFVEAAGAKAGR
jgi:pimeloyl-ACP methyl ester carboxylesterase